MTRTHIDPRDHALEWFVRLQDDDASEADWLAYREWLEASPANNTAYGEIEEAWISVEELDEARSIEQLSSVVVPFQREKPQRVSGVWAQALGFAAAIAAVAVMFIVPGLRDQPQTYRTGVGQIQTVALEDGSRIVLNGSSEIAVRMKRGQRKVALLRGEAAFDVAHDANRPFVVNVGDRAVIVLGTEFNVLHHAGQLLVTVKRGIVSVGAEGRAPEARLFAGQQLSHADGAVGSRVDKVDPEDAFAWRQRLLIYHNRPLTEVSKDLSRYLRKRVIVDSSALKMRFTGSLRIDQEGPMLRDLETFLPLKAVITPAETRLMSRDVQ